jgi:hypothetical protein
MADELNESMEAGPIASNVPERVIDLEYNGDTRTIKERLVARRIRNKKLLREGKEIPEPESTTPKVRYQLQHFENGEGEGNATEYEKWRREKVDAGRAHRLEVEAADRKRNAEVNTSTYEKGIDHKNEIDNQIDDFLADYVRRFGGLDD